MFWIVKKLFDYVVPKWASKDLLEMGKNWGFEDELIWVDNRVDIRPNIWCSAEPKLSRFGRTLKYYKLVSTSYTFWLCQK